MNFFIPNCRRLTVTGIFLITSWVVIWVGKHVTVPLFPQNPAIEHQPGQGVPPPEVRKFLERYESYVTAINRRNFLTNLTVSLLLAFFAACVVDNYVYGRSRNTSDVYKGKIKPGEPTQK